MEALIFSPLLIIMAHSPEQEPKQPGLKLQVLEAVLIALVLLLQYQLWIDADGVRQTYGLRIAIQAQTEENAELAERNQALEADITDLKNGLMAIEERARAEMGMIRPDETFYRILDQPVSSPPPAKPATVTGKAVVKAPAATVGPLAQPLKRPAQPLKRPAANPAPRNDDVIPD